MSEFQVANWSEVPISDAISEIETGVSVNSENRRRGGSEIGILKTSCISRGGFFPEEHKAVLADEVERVKTPLKARSILMSRMNTPNLVGEVGYVQHQHPGIYLPDRLWMFSGKEGISDTLFLSHLLSSDVFRQKLSDIATGTSGSMKNIPQRSFLQIPIQLPPLPEQKKIAEILSGIDNLTKELNNLLNKRRKLLRSTSLSLLGIRNQHPNIQYYSMRLGDCLTLSRGVDITKAIMNPGPYPVISSSGVSGWHNDFTHDQEGVIVGRKGSIGNVHYAHTAHWVHDTSLGVADYKGNCKRYAYHLLKNLDLAKYGTASGSPSLNRNDIHPIAIRLPSPSDQEQIAKTLDNEEVAYGRLQKKIHAFKQLKSAISSDLLSGRKRVSV